MFKKKIIKIIPPYSHPSWAFTCSYSLHFAMIQAIKKLRYLYCIAEVSILS